jgi:uncharacterized delta-60 repeat protein
MSQTFSLRRRPAATTAAMLAVAALGTGVAFAASGDQDPAFNGGATRLIDFPGFYDQASHVAVAPDGSIVVAGCCGGESLAVELARVAPDGQYVDGFGDHGKVDDGSIDGLQTAPQALAVGPQNDVFVGVRAVGQKVIEGFAQGDSWGAGASTDPGDFTVAHYTAAGVPDGTTRLAMPDDGFSGTARTAVLAPQADDGVILAGSYLGSGEHQAFVISKLLGDGTLDPGYGAGGTTVDPTNAYAFGGGHQPGGPAGSIVVAGYSYQDARYVLHRYLSDGTRDDTYGGELALDPDTASSNPSDAAVAPDGSLYVDTGDGTGIRHFGADGQPDATFGTGGIAQAAFDQDGNGTVDAITVQPDGKVVVAGTLQGQVAIVRLTTAGLLDESFGTGGRVLLPLGDGASSMWAADAAMQADGKSVVVGQSQLGGSETVAAARDTERVVQLGSGAQGFVTRLDGGLPPATTTGTTPTTPADTTTTTAQTADASVATTTTPAPVAAAGTISLPSAKSCVSRRSFKIRLRIPRGATAKSAVVKVDGKQVKVVKGARLKAAIDLRGLPKGRFTVTITVKLGDGTTLKGERRYRTCAAKRTGGVPKV